MTFIIPLSIGVALLLWALCAVATYEMARLHFHAEGWPWNWQHRPHYILMAICGPIGLFAVLVANKIATNRPRIA
jgi:hypothetical protein